MTAYEGAFFCAGGGFYSHNFAILPTQARGWNPLVWEMLPNT